MQNLTKKITLSILSVLIAFVGLFGLYSTQNTPAQVSADEVINDGYTFIGSNLVVPVAVWFTASEDMMYSRYPSFVNVFYDFNQQGFNVHLGTITYSIYYYVSSSFFLDENGQTTFNQSLYFISNNDYDGTWHSLFLPFFVNNIQYYVKMSYLVQPEFNNDVSWIQIMKDKNTNIMTTNIIEYHCTNGAVALLHFRSLTSYENFNHRVYYINPPNLADSEIYQTGYSNGYSNGQDTGYTNGYSAGTTTGYNQGKTAGYNQGVAEANNYSFLGLFGAVVDAPIGVISKTFNFEILGVNLKDFFFAMLTLCLSFVIIRYSLGRG